MPVVASEKKKMKWHVKKNNTLKNNMANCYSFCQEDTVIAAYNGKD